MLKKLLIPLLLLVLVVLALGWASRALGETEVFDWPRGGTLKGTRVNFRAGPSVKAEKIGQFASPETAGEFVVTAREEGTMEHPWYRVHSRQFGEGWLYGKYLELEPPGPPVRRYALMVRGEFGLSPEQAVARYGEPISRSEEDMYIPDFVTNIHKERLVFHGHEAEYWNGKLRSICLPGGFMGFGDIVLGMDAAEALGRLGEALEHQGNRWIFAHDRDSIEVVVGTTPQGRKFGVVELVYYRSVYE